MRDLKKYAEKKKKEDAEFAKGYNMDYQDFKAEKILMNQSRLKKFRGKLKWEDNFGEMIIGK